MRSHFRAVLPLTLLISVPAAGVVLQSVSLSESTVTGGTKVIAGTVILDAPALGGGVPVTLSSNNPAAIVEPTRVTVPAGTTTASFTVRTLPVEDPRIRQKIAAGEVWDKSKGPTLVSVVIPVSVVITASPALGFGSPKTAALSVLPPMLSDFGVLSAVVGSTQAAAWVRLTGPAGPGGIALKIASNNQQLADVPATVWIAAGASQAIFKIPTRSIAAPTQVIISASRSLTNFIDATLVLNPPGVGQLGCNPMEVTGGDEVACRVGLNAPPVSAGVIGLSSSDPATATLTPTVIVDSTRYRDIPFTLTTRVGQVSTNLSISASYGDQRLTFPITVRQHAVLVDMVLGPVHGDHPFVQTVRLVLSTPALSALGDAQTASIRCTSSGNMCVDPNPPCKFSFAGPSLVAFQGKEATFDISWRWCNLPDYTSPHGTVTVFATYRGLTKSVGRSTN